ncbi:NADPH2:quinone reductase [Abditibacterium utsteinense]|uniref:NADPH2:quinone reductase n=1 Tax=Abditibacterium utsteinense TaxID=1960156 RepID=A0A2S8SWC1_9BACT|nr:NADPH:quinone reductase [Abditibacterium utsteinense]PQV65090.1 NADPH2:quinone reductase [Abditibacterium utsteinense]
MKAIVVRNYGVPDVLKLEEIAEPNPQNGQVVVEIGAAGVNPVETYRRAGTPPYNSGPLPYTPGSDGAGEIVALGAGVSDWKVGQRVYLFAPKGSGTYAEKCVCDQSEIFALPAHISFEEGAALGVPYATAHRALFGKANAKSGEFVFVHGATGGVGVAAIQLAKRAGLSVGGSAGSAQGEAWLESLGVKYTTNHNAPDYMSDVLGMTCGRGCDIILEMRADKNLGADPQVLAPFGRIVVIGNRGEATVSPRDWMSRDAVIYAMTLFNTPPEELQKIHADLFSGLENGELKPMVGGEFGLQDAARAHEAIGQNTSRGKIILRS